MTTLSEIESGALLGAYGIDMVVEREADGPGAAVSAADELGYPVVLKLCGRAIAHKTERGLVRLGLNTPEQVTTAAEELLGLAREDDGEVALVVAPMLKGERELIAGVATDAQFGRVVMLGIGGIFAEALDDVSCRLAPLSQRDAEDMIDDLRMQRLLGEVRGEPPIDRDRLTAILLGLSRVATEEANVVSVDLNPLIVVGDRPVAVDALVELL